MGGSMEPPSKRVCVCVCACVCVCVGRGGTDRAISPSVLEGLIFSEYYFFVQESRPHHRHVPRPRLILDRHIRVAHSPPAGDVAAPVVHTGPHGIGPEDATAILDHDAGPTSDSRPGEGQGQGRHLSQTPAGPMHIENVTMNMER